MWTPVNSCHTRGSYFHHRIFSVFAFTMGHPLVIVSLQCIVLLFCDVTKYTWPAGVSHKQACFSTVWSCQVHGMFNCKRCTGNVGGIAIFDALNRSERAPMPKAPTLTISCHVFSFQILCICLFHCRLRRKYRTIGSTSSSSGWSFEDIEQKITSANRNGSSGQEFNPSAQKQQLDIERNCFPVPPFALSKNGYRNDRFRMVGDGGIAVRAADQRSWLSWKTSDASRATKDQCRKRKRESLCLWFQPRKRRGSSGDRGGSPGIWTDQATGPGRAGDTDGCSRCWWTNRRPGGGQRHPGQSERWVRLGKQEPFTYSEKEIPSKKFFRTKQAD